MRTRRDLERRLAEIDRRGYPAYKSLRGVYDLGAFELSIDRVQGDPFAAPSALSVHVPAEHAGFAPELYATPERCTALEDLLVRRFAAEARRASYAVRGSGKSGLIATSAPGPEVLPRSACEAGEAGVLMRLEMGFPAHGRTVDARGLARMLFELLPACVERALVCDEACRREARAAMELADDQAAVRAELERRGLVAFVADGSVLPRASGVSSRPLKGAVPFRAPERLAVELDLPHRGRVRGMGLPRGITLIVGGGFHGKSTLLKALQEGVYNHVAGDGRELVITEASAMKLRAEDGRAVHAVDISPFIGDLPDGRDTRAFSTEDASGSTSQAAATVEALEAGARTLLIDEDTSATNFMVRDALMEAVVAPDREPITPFAERVRGLWKRFGVSCVLVMGSSGAFFPVADCVVQMDGYHALDVTERVRAVCRERGVGIAGDDAPGADAGRAAFQASERRMELPGRAFRRDGRGRGPKVRAHGLDGFSAGSGEADLRLVEQLVDAEQVAALAQMVRVLGEERALDGSRGLAEVVGELYRRLERDGWQLLSPYGDTGCGLALPRPQELHCALNRFRVM